MPEPDQGTEQDEIYGRSTASPASKEGGGHPNGTPNTKTGTGGGSNGRHFGHIRGEASCGVDPWEGRRYVSDVDRTTREKHPRLSTKEDMKDVMTPHDDPLVITPIFRRDDNTNVRLHKVLIEIGALVDVLYWNAFINLGLSQADLLPRRAPVRGFGQSEVSVAGIISVPVTLGRHAQATTVNVKFTVVDFTSNA